MDINNQASVAEILQTALASLIPTARESTVDPRDELIIRYTRGPARFSPDKQFISLDLKMYTLDGEEDGTHHAVLQALYKTPQELLNVPPMPTGPMNVPVGPVPHIEPMGQTKAIWSFLDGSSISVVGPSISHLVPLTDGGFIFCCSTGQVVTGGTGRYEGVVGTHQTLGSSFVPPGMDIFGAAITTFEVSNVETFKVIRRRYNRPFTGAGG